MLFLRNTQGFWADRIVLLEDEYGPSSSLLLSSLRRQALAAGCEVLSCTSPFAPYERLEHLFYYPALSLGFVTANSLLSPECERRRGSSTARRFTDRVLLSSRKKRIGFNKMASRQMLLQAQSLLSDAQKVQRALEAIYAPANRRAGAGNPRRKARRPAAVGLGKGEKLRKAPLSGPPF